MPCYELITFLKPEATPLALSNTFREIARLVYREHGQFRTITNYGVRPLAFPIYYRSQKFDEVRWVQMKFDVPPNALPTIFTALSSSPDVLQYKSLKATDILAEYHSEHAPEKLKTFPSTIRLQKERFDPSSMSFTVTSIDSKGKLQ